MSRFKTLGRNLDLQWGDDLNGNFSQADKDLSNLQTQITENENDIESKVQTHKDDTTAHAAEHITYVGNVIADNVKDALDVTDLRIDNIVAQAGTDNTEIVDARNSTTKGTTFPTLNDRLDDTEQDVKGLLEPEYSAELTQDTSIFSLGTGKDAEGNTIDVSSSVVNGQVTASVLGQSIFQHADNGVNYANWSVDTLGSSKSVNGIHLVQNGGSENAVLPVNFKPSTQYTIIFNVIETTLSNVMFLRAINGAFDYQNFTPTKGINKILATTKSVIEQNNLSFAVDGVDGEYIDFKDVMILEGDWTNKEVHYLPYGVNSTVSIRAVSEGANKFHYKQPINFGDMSYSNRLKEFPIKLTAGTYYFKYIGGDVYGKILDESGTITLAENNSSFTITTKQTVYFYGTGNTTYENIIISDKDLPYEPFKQSVAYIPPVGRSLPNGTYDEVNVTQGKYYQRIDAVKFNKADIYQTTTYRYDVPTMKKRTDTTVISSYVLTVNGVSVKEVTTWADVNDNVDSVFWVLGENNSDTARIEVSASLYNSLDGTEELALTYQLETPIVTDLEGITPLQSFENGTLIVEPYLHETYDTETTTITLDYPIVELDALQQSVNGEIVDVDGTLSDDGTTITVPSAGTYLVDGVIRSENSTLPTTVYSAPINRAAQTDGNTAMVRMNAEEILRIIARLEANNL